MIYDLNRDGLSAVVLVGVKEYYIGDMDEDTKEEITQEILAAQEGTDYWELWKGIIKKYLLLFNEAVTLEGLTNRQLEYIVIYLQQALKWQITIE